MMIVYEKLAKALASVGLNEVEIKIYIELAKKPAQTIWELVPRTGESKSSVYRAFNRLFNLKMAKKTKDGLRPLSLKGLMAELGSQEKKITQRSD